MTFYRSFSLHLFLSSFPSFVLLFIFVHIASDSNAYLFNNKININYDGCVYHVRAMRMIYIKCSDLGRLLLSSSSTFLYWHCSCRRWCVRMQSHNKNIPQQTLDPQWQQPQAKHVKRNQSIDDMCAFELLPQVAQHNFPLFCSVFWCAQNDKVKVIYFSSVVRLADATVFMYSERIRCCCQNTLFRFFLLFS